MIQILDYQDVPPSIAASFWWSAEDGVTCDNPRLFAELTQEGILLPNRHIVYPKDGRVFFDALPFRFTGLERAQPSVRVDGQKSQNRKN